MTILFLGPECRQITAPIQDLGHSIVQSTNRVDAEFVRMNSIDFVVSYKYTHILNRAFLESVGRKAVNLHIGYLPWNRGSYPNVWSFIEDTPRGVTIHIIDEGVDTGDILLQAEVAIDLENATLRSSYGLLCTKIEQIFIDNVSEILSMSLPTYPQRGGGTSHKARDLAERFPGILDDLGWDTPVCKLLGLAKS